MRRDVMARAAAWLVGMDGRRSTVRLVRDLKASLAAARRQRDKAAGLLPEPAALRALAVAQHERGHIDAKTRDDWTKRADEIEELWRSLGLPVRGSF